VKQHRLILKGGSAERLHLPVELLREMLAAVQDGARQAARFHVEGSSAPTGPRPRWLEVCTAHVVTGLHPGSAVLELEAPVLQEVAPEQFGPQQQQDLFGEANEPIEPDGSAIDLFVRVLHQVKAGHAAAVHADRALLESCLRLARLPRGDFHSVVLCDREDGRQSVEISPADAPQLEALIQVTPLPQAVRFTCLLDTISGSRQTVLLRADSGETVLARCGPSVDPEALRTLWNERILVTGTAHYRPSGSIQHIAVDCLQRAESRDDLFAHTPLAPSRQPVFYSMPHDQQSGVASFIGTWPGDESDAELIEALQAIR
jgi:hypothetical protein